MSIGWESLAKRAGELDKDQGDVGLSGVDKWVWKDSILIEEFKTLKDPDVSLAEEITLLRDFFCIYLGATSDTKNLGSLCARILSAAKSFGDFDKNLVTFSKESNANVEIPPYKLENRDDIYEKLKNIKEILAPVVLDTEKPADQTEGARANSSTLAEDINNEGMLLKLPIGSSPTERVSPTFIQDMKAAFAALEAKTNVSRDDVKTTLISVSHTAVFLIFVLFRRVVKRPEDLVAAFSRDNIHRHYTQMVVPGFGMFLPAPSSDINWAAESAFSPTAPGGAQLATIILTAYTAQDKLATDKPSAYLGQSLSGQEAMLRATCMTHLAGTGLTLLSLFTQVKILYSRNTQKSLELISFELFKESCSTIVTFKEKTNHLKNEDASIGLKLLPYCRMVSQRFHPELAARGHEAACFMMAALIDLKMPPAVGTGGARSAMWARSLSQTAMDKLNALAQQVHAKRTAMDLTPAPCNRDIIMEAMVAGSTWNNPSHFVAPHTYRPSEQTSASDDAIAQVEDGYKRLHYTSSESTDISISSDCVIIIHFIMHDEG